MRVAVTGARGFIGSALEPALRRRGHTVQPVAREALRDATAYAGCEAVVHLANVAHTAAPVALLEEVNVSGTRHAAECAARAGARRFVYLSSIKASGEETRGRSLDGSEAPLPQSAYGRAKLAAERALAEVAERRGLEAVLLRPTLVYGPNVKANFLALMRAIAGGWPLPFASVRNRRSLAYVGNVTDAIVCCLEAVKIASRPYVICDERAVSTPELCRLLGEALGRPARLFPFPAGVFARLPGSRALARSLEADASALVQELGWGAAFSLEEGLKKTADWYRLECAP
jgi:UDP-glucose 4-epimerase